MEIVINKTIKNIAFADTKINKIIEKILKKEGKSKASFSINFVGESKIKSLNKIYRKKDKVTDVISFALQDDKRMGESDELGDVFICPKQVKRQAKEFGVSYKEEMTRILVHGVLHLLGYDHMTSQEEKKMFVLQERLVKDFL